MLQGKLAISIKPTIGVGDALQFSSLPENFYRQTGKKLIDISQPWFFDHNPFVLRNRVADPSISQELWNFSPSHYPWPRPTRKGPFQPQVYLSNAEIWAELFGVPVVLNRPRLYRFEEVMPYHDRKIILLHAQGKSHGRMPEHVIKHVIRKYGPTECLYEVGLPGTPDIGIPKIVTPNLWDLAKVLSEARMFIGVDSGPAWIASCYPDVVVKKLRTRPSPEYFKSWVPLEIDNVHAHWDSREHLVYNISEDDVGFTWSYRRI